MNILSVKNLSKIYGDENNHVIALIMSLLMLK